MRTATPDFSMDADPCQITSVRCAAVLDNVIDGTISVKDGIARLHMYRRSLAGTEHHRAQANLALRLLAHNADTQITQISQRALHEQLNEEMWNLFTKYYEETERLVQEYHEVIMEDRQTPASNGIIQAQTCNDGLDQSEPF